MSKRYHHGNDHGNGNVQGVFQGNQRGLFWANGNGHSQSNVLGASQNGDPVIVNPTERVVNVNTRRQTVKNIHPQEIVNVNRTIVRNENYYPVVCERDVNKVIVENYNCGSDLNNPRCVRVPDNHHHCKCCRR